MPWQSPVGDTRNLSDQVADVGVVCSVKLWDSDHNGSLWFHPSAVINITPGSGNTNNTIQTPNGEVVPVILSRSGLLI